MKTAMVRWTLTVLWVALAVYIPHPALQKAVLFTLLLSMAAANEMAAYVRKRERQ